VAICEAINPPEDIPEIVTLPASADHGTKETIADKRTFFIFNLVVTIDTTG
jgi:hypothetical protein